MNTAKKVLRSSGFVVVARFIQRSIGIVSMLVLARLLLPEDFGVLAIVMLVVHFSDVFSSSGIMQYLMQAADIDEDVINTAWTFDIILKVITVLLIILALPIFSIIWENENITLAIAALSPIILLKSLNNPELHVDRRNLSYDRVFRLLFVQKIIAFLTVVSVAILVRSYWAIVIAELIANTFAVIYSHHLCQYRPKLTLIKLKQQWEFSKWMLGRGYVGFIRAQVDILIVSQNFQLPLVGKYNIAREIAVLPATDVMQPGMEPLLASLSQVRENRDRLRNQLDKIFLIIATIVTPVCLFLFFHAEQIVIIFLGEKWIEVGGLVSALSPLLYVYTFGALLTNLLVSLGRVKELFYYDIVSLVLITIILIEAGSINLEIFAWLRSVLGLCITIPFLIFVLRRTGLSVLRALLRIMVTIVVSLAALGVAGLMSNSVNPFFDFFLKGILFVVLYLVVLYAISCFFESWRYLSFCYRAVYRKLM